MLWGETSQRMEDKKKQSHITHSEEKKDEMENYKEIRTGGPTTNPNSEVEEEGEMEELAGFKAVTYRRYRRRQWQQVLIGTSSDSEIKAEKKKAWLYLRTAFPKLFSSGDHFYQSECSTDHSILVPFESKLFEILSYSL
jgi:hypothetical protein